MNWYATRAQYIPHGQDRQPELCRTVDADTAEALAELIVEQQAIVV